MYQRRALNYFHNNQNRAGVRGTSLKLRPTRSATGPVLLLCAPAKIPFILVLSDTARATLKHANAILRGQSWAYLANKPVRAGHMLRCGHSLLRRVSLALIFSNISWRCAPIHSPPGASGAEAAPRMHNSIWRQEKVTPAAQATETAHTYVMSHFVMLRHAPHSPPAKPETKPVCRDDAFFNYLRAHRSQHWRRSEFRIAMINWVGSERFRAGVWETSI
jgi:hypothetical protein